MPTYYLDAQAGASDFSGGAFFGERHANVRIRFGRAVLHIGGTTDQVVGKRRDKEGAGL